MIEFSSLGELAGGLFILYLEPIIFSTTKESVQAVGLNACLKRVTLRLQACSSCSE